MIDSSIVENIGAISAFAEGLISFFSPCVIPLLPIYFGYLSGALEDQKPSRKKTLLFTVTFIAGIFIALLLLNVSITWVSGFFKDSGVWFMRIGGILIVVLGLMQLGVLKLPILERTFHFSFDFSQKRMSMVIAFLMGFTFSFSWTPCIGPALAAILIMAGSTGSFLTSAFLVVCYAIGFSLPFLLMSFFSKQAVMFFRKHEMLMQVIVKVGAIILIVMGMLMAFGGLSVLGGGGSSNQTFDQQDSQQENGDSIRAPQFALKDQFDQKISLQDYEGKVVYINFWGTWCPNCREELDDIQKLYDTYHDSGDVAVLTMVYPNGGYETDIAGIKAYIEEHKYTFPVLFDESGTVFSEYGITSFPTLFVIQKDQSIYGYLPGRIDYKTMDEIIQTALTGKKPQQKEDVDPTTENGQ